LAQAAFSLNNSRTAIAGRLHLPRGFSSACVMISTRTALNSRHSQHLQPRLCKTVSTVDSSSQSRCHDEGVNLNGLNPISKPASKRSLGFTPRQAVLTKLEGSTQAVSFDTLCNMLDDETISQSLSNPHWASVGPHKKMQTMDESEDLMLQEMIQRRKSRRFQKKTYNPITRLQAICCSG